MTLSVDVFLLDEDGESHVQEVPEGSSDLAGPEVWRTAVWGAEAVRALGARFFPRLVGGWLVAQPDEVIGLLDECALLRRSLAPIARGTAQGDCPDGVRAIGDRLTNIEAACHRALAIGGGVLVW
ncbi:hypothetical protein [Streptomyces sp. NBC_00102]|uniref:hypothetical protein n=1 Tax=Streptomyces sp. NBC_00102 TaxID=2975652 RepID=UPI00224CBA27|nr:hypothetical protein [Streptomyces sp. NBC_00102]MCX5397277.1 hypothetical protein [Streptomyces sp. NBC_00102]